MKDTKGTAVPSIRTARISPHVTDEQLRHLADALRNLKTDETDVIPSAMTVELGTDAEEQPQSGPDLLGGSNG